MREIKHKVYNPKLESLESVLFQEPMESNWMLIKLMQVTETEFVAVFEKMYEDEIKSYARERGELDLFL